MSSIIPFAYNRIGKALLTVSARVAGHRCDKKTQQKQAKARAAKFPARVVRSTATNKHRCQKPEPVPRLDQTCGIAWEKLRLLSFRERRNCLQQGT